MNAPLKNVLDSSFVKLSKVDVSAHIEKKGQFSYLSWPFAVSQLRQVEPTASWEVKRFNGLPYLHTELGYFVEVGVTVQGLELTQIHPVLDGRNRPIPAPSAFDINTSIQRCLVKAIALHGLGLNIYAGEDLPLVEDQEEKNEAAKRQYDFLLSEYRTAALKGMKALATFHDTCKGDQKAAVWTEHKSSLKAAAETADREAA